jgi:tripartite-type tricarboxylate transporter receptor subunit TctC
VFARTGTPRSAAAWLREHVASTVKEPATQERLIAMGLEPATMAFERFATRINTEQERWAPVLRASRMPMKDGA